MSWRSWMITAAFALAAGSCCSIPVDLDRDGGGRDEPPDDDDGDDDDDDDVERGRLDLGTASFPDGASAKRVVHPWWLPKLKPNKYQLGYKLDSDAGDDIDDHYKTWARRMGHRKIDKDRFQWRPPRRCHGGLHCVYETLDQGSANGVEPLSTLFRKRALKANLDKGELAALVITFVQEIHYRIPEDEPFGVMPPALVVRNKWGDCDSKTLLAHMILRSLGIRSVLISSNAHKHTMLGVALPAPGRSFKYQGTKYAFVEMTAKRSPIGHINPKLLRPNDWRVVSMRYKKVGQLPKAGDDTRDDGNDDSDGRGAAEIMGGGRIRLE